MTPYVPKDVYVCDGVAFEFPVSFEVDSLADILVFLENPDGSTKRMLRDLDYTVTEAAGAYTVVTRVDDYRDPIAAGIKLTIMRAMDILQPSTSSSVSPKVFANRIDTLTRVYQQLREKLDRTLHVGLRYPPYYFTSHPYSLYANDSAAFLSWPEGGLGMFSAQQNRISMGSFPLDGGVLTLDKLLEYTDWPAEELSIGPSIPVSGGVIDEVLLAYTDWPDEELDVGPSIPVSGGVLDVALLTYSNYIPEEIFFTSVPVSGGSLT